MYYCKIIFIWYRDGQQNCQIIFKCRDGQLLESYDFWLQGKELYRDQPNLICYYEQLNNFDLYKLSEWWIVNVGMDKCQILILEKEKYLLQIRHHSSCSFTLLHGRSQPVHPGAVHQPGRRDPLPRHRFSGYTNLLQIWIR